MTKVGTDQRVVHWNPIGAVVAEGQRREASDGRDLLLDFIIVELFAESFNPGLSDRAISDPVNVKRIGKKLLTTMTKAGNWYYRFRDGKVPLFCLGLSISKSIRILALGRPGIWAGIVSSASVRVLGHFFQTNSPKFLTG